MEEPQEAAGPARRASRGLAMLPCASASVRSGGKRTDVVLRHQQCNREWPCDRRKIADECRYAYSSAPGPGPNPHHVVVDDGSRDRPGGEPPAAAPVPASCCAAGAGSPAEGPGFDALAAARLFTTLGIASQVRPRDPRLGTCTDLTCSRSLQRRLPDRTLPPPTRRRRSSVSCS